jgi:hypothetical protein
MSWIVEGNSDELRIIISELGCYEITGTASVHNLTPAFMTPGGDFLKNLARINAAECLWSINSSANADDTVFDLGNLDLGFLEQVRAKPEGTLAAINFYNEPDAVGINIALPKRTFEMAIDLFKLVISGHSIGYRFALGVSGFGFPVEDFTSKGIESKYVITDKVTIQIKRNIMSN